MLIALADREVGEALAEEGFFLFIYFFYMSSLTGSLKQQLVGFFN